MKSSALPAIVATALAGSAQGAVIINKDTLNGSFELGTGATVITNWIAPNVANGYLSRGNNLASEGAWSLIVGTNSASSQVGGGVINTGYSISQGDVFYFSFDLKAAFNGDPEDQVAWAVYYTSDNTIGGARTNLFNGEVVTEGQTYKSSGMLVSNASSAAAAGRTLFVSFGAGLNMTADEFARVDNVVLSVVPEPSVMGAVAGLGIIGLLKRRRH